MSCEIASLLSNIFCLMVISWLCTTHGRGSGDGLLTLIRHARACMCDTVLSLIFDFTKSRKCKHSNCTKCINVFVNIPFHSHNFWDSTDPKDLGTLDEFLKWYSYFSKSWRYLSIFKTVLIKWKNKIEKELLVFKNIFKCKYINLHI